MSTDAHAGIMISRLRAEQNVCLIVLNISHIKEFPDIYCTNFHTEEILFLHVLDTFYRI